MERRMEGEWKGLLGQEGRWQEGLEERRREGRRPRKELGRWRQEEVRDGLTNEDAMDGLDGRAWTPSPGSPLDSLGKSVDAVVMDKAPERGMMGVMAKKESVATPLHEEEMPKIYLILL